MKHLADASLAADGTLDHVDQAKLATARHHYHSAILIGKQQTAARSSPLMRKHHALARRLLEREDDYLRYTTDPRAPFDNYADAAVMPMFAARGRSGAGQGGDLAA